jgi:hypothetical protein
MLLVGWEVLCVPHVGSLRFGTTTSTTILIALRLPSTRRCTVQDHTTWYLDPWISHWEGSTTVLKLLYLYVEVLRNKLSYRTVRNTYSVVQPVFNLVPPPAPHMVLYGACTSPVEVFTGHILSPRNSFVELSFRCITKPVGGRKWNLSPQGGWTSTWERQAQPTQSLPDTAWQ